MDRTQYQLPFSLDNVPVWNCPICQNGHLVIEKKSLISKETAQSLREKDDESWEPDWIRSIFSCLFVCDNKKCQSPISCCGTGGVDFFEHYDDEHGPVQIAEEKFTPEFFYPHLILMDIPKDCPEDVSRHLKESFSLFFSSPGSALNSARTAIEALLNDLGVKKFNIANGRKRVIPLHRRIELLPVKHREVIELLTAVKWLGNAGSHDGEDPTKSDAQIAFNLLEHILAEIYDKKTEKLKKIAKAVNKKKGPVKSMAKSRKGSK